MKTYRVKSIFGPTLQGEGSFSGTCTLFLRFAGCNRWSGLEKDRAKSFCKFCDTDFREGESLTAEKIVERLDALGGPKRVVITGGEPTLQLDFELLSRLKASGYETHLETNGSRPLGGLSDFLDKRWVLVACRQFHSFKFLLSQDGDNRDLGNAAGGAALF